MSLRLSVRPRTLSPFARVHARRSAQLVAMALLLLGSAACGDDDDDASPTAPTSGVEVQVAEPVITIIRTVEPTAQVAATVTGDANTAVTWSSFDTSIATVSESGAVTALKDGSTFVTAVSAADPTKQRSVVVKVISTVVSVDPTSVYSWVGGPTRQITPTVENNNNTAVSWISTNTAVATVSSTGVVTPVAAGTTNIIAKSDADPVKSATTTFNVDPAPPAATELTSGVAITGLSGAAGSAAYFRIAVPVGATKLVFATTGGGAGADIDIYATPAEIPTYDNETAHAFTASAAETITIDNPDARYYYVFLDGFTAYSDLTMTATVTVP